MTTDHMETHDEYIARMADDGMGGLADEATIKANIRDAFEDLGIVYDDPGDIPSTATIRPAGEFYDAHDARQWLEQGGLVGSTNGGEVQPLGWVYFYAYFDANDDEVHYEVWIDEDTNPV